MKPERTRNRALWALAGSLALHGGALLWLVQGRAAAPAPPPAATASATRVVLFDVASPPGAGSVPAAARQERARVSPQAPVRSAPSRPSRSPEAPAAPSAAVESDSTDSVASAETSPAVASAGAAPGEGWRGDDAAPVGLASTANGPAGSPEDSGSGGGVPGGRGSAPEIAELHQRLAAAALRCYPDAARRFRARGEVVVSFCLDGTGNATDVARVASSGSALLDRAATECVLPGALPVPGAAGCYRVPVVFGSR